MSVAEPAAGQELARAELEVTEGGQLASALGRGAQRQTKQMKAGL